MTTTMNNPDVSEANIRHNAGAFDQPHNEYAQTPPIRLEELLVDNDRVRVITDAAAVEIKGVRVKDHGYSEASVTFVDGILSNAGGTVVLPHNEPMVGEFSWDYSILPGKPLEFSLVGDPFRGALVKLGAVATIHVIPKSLTQPTQESKSVGE
jgi:hypothetical protein